MPRLIIFANGLVPELESARQILQPGDVLCAADGGTRHALELGLIPSVVIGDLDSLSSDDRFWLASQSVEFQQFSRDKDETDLELALHYGLQAGYREILIVGGLGGRIDQTLGNLSLLTNPELDTLEIRMDDGVEEVFFTHSQCRICGRRGDRVSLIPWGGEVSGITTQGLRWPLRSETLFPDRTRGISNEMLDDQATIHLKSGLLLVIHQRQK